MEKGSVDDSRGRYLSVAYRTSKEIYGREDNLQPITVATLFSSLPHVDKPFFTELIGSDDFIKARNWYRQYIRVILKPVIGIYMLYGIGLEAHQQNSIVNFDDHGWPHSLLMRDFGDGRTYAPTLEQQGLSIRPYVNPKILPTVFTDIHLVRMFIINACFVNNLYEMALCIANQYKLHTKDLLSILKEETAKAFVDIKDRADPELWEQESEAFLKNPWPIRSTLRIHLLEHKNYRILHSIANPLNAASAAS